MQGGRKRGREEGHGEFRRKGEKDFFFISFPSSPPSIKKCRILRIVKVSHSFSTAPMNTQPNSSTLSNSHQIACLNCFKRRNSLPYKETAKRLIISRFFSPKRSLSLYLYFPLCSLVSKIWEHRNTETQTHTHPPHNFSIREYF